MFIDIWVVVKRSVFYILRFIEFVGLEVKK